MDQDRRIFLGAASAMGMAAFAGMADGATPDNGAPQDQLGMPSTMTNPRLEFAMEVTLEFTRVQNIEDMPQGFGRGAVDLDGGSFQGPKLRGRAVPDSGGDYAMFRPDDVLSFDARYLLEEDDGTMIVIYNAGYLWGRQPDTMAKIREWIFNNGPEVPHSEYYLRAFPRFEVQSGKHDWLMRHVFIGVGERLQHGNRFRYYALT